LATTLLPRPYQLIIRDYSSVGRSVMHADEKMTVKVKVKVKLSLCLT